MKKPKFRYELAITTAITFETELSAKQVQRILRFFKSAEAASFIADDAATSADVDMAATKAKTTAASFKLVKG